MNAKAEFGPKERAAVETYLTAKPKQTGTLHERMKYLLALQEELRPHIERAADERCRALFEELRHAAFDLQTEVAYTSPARPPFGDRPNAPRLNEIRQCLKG